MKLSSMVSVEHNPGDPPIKTNTDWAAVDALTHEQIRAAALSDPDAQPLPVGTDEEMAKLGLIRIPNVKRVTTTLLDSISNGNHAETSPSQKRVLLLKPRGFCAGVVRAIDIVKIALETFGAPIYVRREIVHNRYVVNELAEKGAIFVHEIDDVPDGQRVIYSAHGVSPAVRARSKGRNLRVIDATCPLVTKVHIEAVKFARQGYSLVLIGHRDHDEIEGTLGEAPEATQVVSNVAEVAALQVPDPDRVAYLTQTTLSLDEARDIIHALKVKFPNIAGPHSQDICYATENRQVAVRNVAHDAGLVLVVGSTNSSNSNRLVEVSRNLGTIGYLIDNSAGDRSQVAGWRDDGGGDGRRIGARGAGGRRGQLSATKRIRSRRRGGSDAGECSLRAAPGDCASHRQRGRGRSLAGAVTITPGLGTRD
jgi:4-hydroxy-3-methylbut-2-enyl diphosphate reductase